MIVNVSTYMTRWLNTVLAPFLEHYPNGAAMSSGHTKLSLNAMPEQHAVIWTWRYNTTSDQGRSQEVPLRGGQRASEESRLRGDVLGERSESVMPAAGERFLERI